MRPHAKSVFLGGEALLDAQEYVFKRCRVGRVGVVSPLENQFWVGIGTETLEARVVSIVDEDKQAVVVADKVFARCEFQGVFRPSTFVVSA